MFAALYSSQPGGGGRPASMSRGAGGGCAPKGVLLGGGQGRQARVTARMTDAVGPRPGLGHPGTAPAPRGWAGGRGTAWQAREDAAQGDGSVLCLHRGGGCTAMNPSRCAFVVRTHAAVDLEWACSIFSKLRLSK